MSKVKVGARRRWAVAILAALALAGCIKTDSKKRGVVTAADLAESAAPGAPSLPRPAAELSAPSMAERAERR